MFFDELSASRFRHKLNTFHSGTWFYAVEELHLFGSLSFRSCSLHGFLMSYCVTYGSILAHFVRQCPCFSVPSSSIFRSSSAVDVFGGALSSFGALPAPHCSPLALISLPLFFRGLPFEMFDSLAPFWRPSAPPWRPFVNGIRQKIRW